MEGALIVISRDYLEYWNSLEYREKSLDKSLRRYQIYKNSYINQTLSADCHFKEKLHIYQTNATLIFLSKLLSEEARIFWSKASKSFDDFIPQIYKNSYVNLQISRLLFQRKMAYSNKSNLYLFIKTVV